MLFFSYSFLCADFPLSAVCAFIHLPHSCVRKTPWEESRAQLWPPRQQKTDLLHRRHEHAWGGCIWHGSASHTNTPTHGLQPLVRRCHLSRSCAHMYGREYTRAVWRSNIILIGCAVRGDFQKMLHQHRFNCSNDGQFWQFLPVLTDKRIIQIIECQQLIAVKC